MIFKFHTQMIRYFKELFPHEFRQRLKRVLFAHQDMNARLLNLRRANFSPSGVVDGGAYQGDWTRTLWTVWPDCPSLMIEPLPSQFQVLSSLAAKTNGSAVAPKAVGSKRGEVLFRLGETNSSIVSDGAREGTIKVECTTLDDLLDEISGFKPDMLKLDLQGHELEALAGAERHLKQFEVIILEVSVLRIGEVPVFSEVDRFMEARGYRLYDVLPQYYRPLDGALWQMDVFYVRDDSALIASRNWN